jgi:hypothetical protein
MKLQSERGLPGKIISVTKSFKLGDADFIRGC